MKLESLIMDVRTARRSLAREPRYAAIVVITLALGIAANTVIFSVMNPYLIRPLPFEEAHRLVQLGHVDKDREWNMHRFSIRQLEDLTERSSSLEALGAYHYGKRNLVTEGTAEQVPMKRIGQTAEIAKTVAFLLSDGAGYITGQSLRVDGGITRHV